MRSAWLTSGVSCFALAGMTWCGGPTAAAPAVTYHVATTGSDTADGSAATPFASLTRARQAVRALKAAGDLPAGGVAVMVHGGTFELTESFTLGAEDGGTETAPVLWLAAPGEEVRLSGGRQVPASSLSPVTDPAVLARLVPEARGQVLTADLTELGITELGAFPPRFRGAPAAPELFFNEQRQTLARWPNEGWASVDKIIEAGSNPRNNDNSNRPPVFQYAGDRPDRWQVDRGVWLLGYWCFDWYEETIQAAAIDPTTKQIRFAAPAYYSLRQGNPSPRRWAALNLLEELDQPGEFYLDREHGRLYLWPPADPTGARLVLSVLNAPLLAVTGAANLTVRGFIVEAGLDVGIRVTGGERVAVEACTVRNFRNRGVEISDGLHHRVAGCDIHDTGTGGLLLAGGDRKSLTPAGHEAVNNHIWGFSRHQLTYASGITFAGVGNRAAHNLLEEAPHMAVALNGNDHIFEYNEVRHVLTETDDAGALYKGRNPSMTGNVIRYNFWHNIGSPMGHGNAAIYFDDGDGGEVVYGNLFFRSGEPGRGNFGTIFNHGGHGCLAENNVFVECRRAVGSSPWNDQRWKSMIAGALWQERLLKEVDITQPPYTTRYPFLADFMAGQPASERFSTAVRNLFVMCGEVSSGNWRWDPEQNLVTSEDPGFVDAANGDFRLRPDSAVFTKLPGFEPLPVERMGLIADALRPNPPARQWTYPPPQQAEPPQRRAATPPPPAPVRTGPPPEWRTPRLTTTPTIDGQLEAGEWPLNDQALTLPLAVNYGGDQATRPSVAWLAHDGQALYLAVRSPVAAGTNLAGHDWGVSEAVEVSLRSGDAKRGPIHVVRGYPDGRLEYGTAATAGDVPGTTEPATIRYQSTVVSPELWQAELAIPFAMVDHDLAAGRELWFNLTVRKVADNAWVMWQPSHGNSYNVDRGGLLVLE